MGDCMMPSPQQRHKIHERLKQRIDRIRRQSDSHNNSYENRMTAKNAHEQQDTERYRARYFQNNKAKINKTNCNSRVKQEGGQLRTPKIEKDLNGDASCQPHPNLMKLLNSGQTTTNNKRKRESSLCESDMHQLPPKKPNHKLGENVSSTSMSIDITLHDNKKTNVNVTISQQQDTLAQPVENDAMSFSPATRNDNTCFVSDIIDGRIEFKDIENDIRDPNQYKQIEQKIKELEEEWHKELIASYGSYGVKSVDSKTDENQDLLINSTNSPGMSIGQVDGQINNTMSKDSPAAAPPQNNGAGGAYDMKGPPNTVATDVKTPTSETLPNIAELRPNQQPNHDILRQPIKTENQQFMNSIARNSPKNPSVYKNPALKREPMAMVHGQQNFQNTLPSISKPPMGFTATMVKSEPLQNQQVQNMNGMFQQQQQQQQPNINAIPGQAAPKQVFNGPGGRVFEDPQKIPQYTEYQPDAMMPVNIDRTPNVSMPVRAQAPNILANQQQQQQQQQTQKKALPFKQTSMPIIQQILRQPHQQQQQQQQYVNKLQQQQQLTNGSSLLMQRPMQKAQHMRLMMYKQQQLLQQQQQQQQQQNPQLIQTQNMQDQMKQVMNGRPPPRYEETRTMNNVVYQNNQISMQQAQMARQNPNSMNPPDYRQTNTLQGMAGMPTQGMQVQHGQAGQTMQALANQQNTMYNYQDQNAQGFQQQHGQNLAIMRLAAGQNSQLRPAMNRQNMHGQNANMLARGQMLQQQQQRVWQGRNRVMNQAMSQNMLQATPQASTAVANPRYQNAFDLQGDMQFQQQNQNFTQAAAPAMNSNNVNMRRFYPMANRQQQLNTNVQTTISMGAHQQPSLDQQLQVSTGVTYGNPNVVPNTVNIHQNIMNSVPLSNPNAGLHNPSKQFMEADLNDLEAILSNPM